MSSWCTYVSGAFVAILNRNTKSEINLEQECIPVGCVPSAAVAVCRGGGTYLGGTCPGAPPPPPWTDTQV